MNRLPANQQRPETVTELTSQLKQSTATQSDPVRTVTGTHSQTTAAPETAAMKVGEQEDIADQIDAEIDLSALPEVPHPDAGSKDHLTSLWRGALIGASAYNVANLARIYVTSDFSKPYVAAHAGLSAVYTGVGAFRSALPRLSLQRYVMVNHPASSIAAGRSAATIAEISFSVQNALMLHQIGNLANLEWVSAMAIPVPIMITAAQVACWYSVATLNNIGHAVEESIWATTFGMVTTGLVASATQLQGTWQHISIGGSALYAMYLMYMVGMDVPMYVKRWMADKRNNAPQLGLCEGLADSAKRQIVTRRFEDWKNEFLWMGAYFSGAVLLSQSMIQMSQVE